MPLVVAEPASPFSPSSARAGDLICGDYAAAEGPVTRALSIRERELAPDALGLAECQFYAGWLYDDQGRYDEAEPLYHRSLSIVENVLGPEHPAVATVLSNLAGLYEAQGRAAEASALRARAGR